MLCCSGTGYETISCSGVQSRQSVALHQLVTCDLFQLAEVSAIMMIRVKKVRWMIHQILKALILTKVTGMNLSTVSSPVGVDFCDSVSVDNNTTVFEVPTDHGIVTAMFVHSVIDDTNNKTKISTCGSESQRQIFTA